MDSRLILASNRFENDARHRPRILFISPPIAAFECRDFVVSEFFTLPLHVAAKFFSK